MILSFCTNFIIVFCKIFLISSVNFGGVIRLLIKINKTTEKVVVRIHVSKMK